MAIANQDWLQVIKDRISTSFSNYTHYKTIYMHIKSMQYFIPISHRSTC